MEPHITTVSNKCLQSGTWSNNHNLDRQQHGEVQYTTTTKSNFLTKLIQKRTINTSNTSLLDDKSCTMQQQSPLPPALQSPALSALSSKTQGQIKTKKTNSLGRFLKKLGKNVPTEDASNSQINIFNTNDNLSHPSTTLADTAHREGQSARVLDVHVSDHPKSLITTPTADQVRSSNAAQSPPLYLEALLLNSTTQDDLKLRYHPSNDVAHYTHLIPRSTSFDIYRSHQHSPPSSTGLRCSIPERQNRHYQQYSLVTRNKGMNNAHTLPLRITNATDSAGVRGGIHECSTGDDGNDKNDDDEGDEDEDGGDYLTDGFLNAIPLTGQRLSKRLSGGHFGSAGGLNINTLSSSDISIINHAPIHHNNSQQVSKNDYNDQHPTSEPTPTAAPPISQQEQNKHFQNVTGYRTEPDCPTDTMEALDSSGFAILPIGPLNQKVGSEYVTSVDMDSKNEYHDDSDSKSPTSSVQPSTMNCWESTPEDYARRIWEQDMTVYSDMEHVAEWIGDGSSSSYEILKCYMSYFDFAHRSLEDALRQLCGKLSLKAESQQIDRILESFSKRYWDCNPQSIFGNADVIHTIVYSLVLLNTDLHVAQGERKMTKSAFVRNTLNAIHSPLIYLQISTATNSGTGNWENSNISTFSLDNSHISCDLHHHHQECNDLNRTPSYHSADSESSNHRVNVTSSLNMSYGTYGWQVEMESILKQLYASIRQNQILHPGLQSVTNNSHGQARHNGQIYRAVKQNVGSRMKKAARDSLLISDTKLAELDFLQPLIPRTAVSSMSAGKRSRKSILSIHSGVSQHAQYARNNNVNQQQQQQCGIIFNSSRAVASLLHRPDLPESYINAAPYYKEGLIERKHLMEQARNKARRRDWKQCFVVVNHGGLRMYRLSSYYQRRKSIAMSGHHSLHDTITRGTSLATVSESLLSCEQHSSTSDLGIDGDDLPAHAKKIGEIDLKHTLSRALPSGYSRQRRHAFALQQANGGVYLFQVGSAEQALEWATTCNYWAARESKEPLMGGVGNLEYGWGACLDGTSDKEKDYSNNNDWPEASMTTVCQWQPPIPPLMASSLGEMAQHNALLQHITALNKELDGHRDLKPKIELRHSSETPNYICAMTNFENKTQYLLHEIIKYQNYCDSIEKSLALQDKAIQKEEKH